MIGSTILARLDRLPKWPYRWLALITIGAGYFFSAFDSGIIGLVLPDIEAQFHVSAEKAARTITSGLVGYMLGAFVVGRISDQYGRRIAALISIALFTIGSLGCALTHTIESLIAWRFVTGMGIGAEIAVVTTLMGELTPAPCRGKYMSWVVGGGLGACVILPLIAVALLPHHAWGWRVFFSLSAINGGLIAITRLWVPESPRWLVSQNRLQDADNIVHAAEENLLRQHIILPPPAVTIQSTILPLSFKQLFQSRYLIYIFLFFTIWFVYYLGAYAFSTLTTNLLMDKGFGLTKSLWYVSLFSFGYIPGACLAIVLGDRYERKWMAFTILLTWSVALLCIGWSIHTFALMMGGFLAAMMSSSLTPILYLYTAEHFPTANRTTCVALTDGVGHLGAAICGQVIFGIYIYFQATVERGFSAAFTGMAITGLLAAGLILFGKRTSKQILH